jgi:hypothetical protein
LSCEQVLTLSQAAERLPKRPNGKSVHVATIYRWAMTGLRGVRLETLPVGGTICTSAEALQRFAEALAETPRSRRGFAPRPALSKARQRARRIAQANKRLDRAGI